MRKAISNPVVQFGATLLVLSLLPLIAPLPLERITQVAIFALFTTGVMLLVGYLGLVPFGGSVFFGLAGYAAAISMLRWFGNLNEFVGMAFALIFSIAVSIPVGALILRRRGLYFSLLTVACAQICFEIAIGWTDFTGGENGLQNVPRPILDSSLKFHTFVVSVAIAVFWLVWRLVHSPLGRLFQAVRDNEQRVSSLGYSSYRIKLAAFVVFAAITGLSGTLVTFFIRGTYANYLSWERAADPLFMTVLGGIFHPLGALWGAAIFVILPDQLSQILQNWWLVFAPTLILMALTAPEGVHGLIRRAFGLKGWTLVRSSIPERPSVIEPFAAKASDVTGVRNGSPIITVRGLTKRFGSLVVASGFDFDVHQECLHSFIGPNGAGKTTFFNMLSGVTLPHAATISFRGRNITRQKMHVRCRAGLARSFQIVSVFKNLTAFENVRLSVQATRPGAYAFWKDAYDNSEINRRVWSILDAVGLTERAGEICTKLSHGERRLLDIGITLATDADVLLLDEPLAGLAEADRDRVSALILALAKTHAVVLIEHDIDRVIAMSDRITVLHQGRLIADGKPADVAANPDVIRAYLGAPSEPRETTANKETTEQIGDPVLQVSRLVTGYGGGRVLHGVNLTVRSGEAVGLLGRNGVGKTTLLRALFGLLPLESGKIVWLGRDIYRLRPFEISRLGLSMVPEGRRLFPNLTTLDNLRIAMRRGGISLDEVFELFPRLSTVRYSRAENLSGGERQMVAIARALLSPTSLILLDEPFEGLAPSVVNEVIAALRKLRGRVAMVLVEHHAEQVLSLVDRAIVLVNGSIAWEGNADVLAADTILQSRLLGLVEQSPPIIPALQSAKAEMAR
jgi:ABC-type branched-subunit amino acid transport system ATPase component/ABC-type branched-subunit amino acid transport system permease subunit